jgi:RNA-directed DNA polymerase
VQGYCLKSDIKKYFDNVNHEIIINIIKKKISDEKVIWLIRQILNNFDNKTAGKGMPLGNYTSQFLANVYLNELNYFVKHTIKARSYNRYVDDFVILHKRKRWLEVQKEIIDIFLRENLKIEMHPDKSQIVPLRDGVTFVGYRIFYHHKMLRKRNIRKFMKSFERRLKLYEADLISHKKFIEQLQGWFGYAKLANTHKFRKKILERIEKIKMQKVNGVTIKLH